MTRARQMVLIIVAKGGGGVGRGVAWRGVSFNRLKSPLIENESIYG